MRYYKDSCHRVVADYGLGAAVIGGGLGQMRSATIRCERPATGATLAYLPCTYDSLDQGPNSADACCRRSLGPDSQACRRSTR